MEESAKTPGEMLAEINEAYAKGEITYAALLARSRNVLNKMKPVNDEIPLSDAERAEIIAQEIADKERYYAEEAEYERLKAEMDAENERLKKMADDKMKEEENVTGE